MIGTHETPSAESAAFVNGCFIRYLDFSDTFPGHHPSDALGALLAVKNIIGRGGADLVTAMVISYELSARFTKIGQFNRRGWDNGYATGIGAAAGTARLLGLSRDRLREAVAIAATATVPLRATRSGQLSMWKGAATAHAVRDAIFAAQLAAVGMTGPEAPFTGRHGVMEQITGPMELIPLGTEGGGYLLPKVKLKYWPLVHNLQPLVFAGIELRKQLAGREPTEIQIATCANAKRESGSEPAKWDPRTRETADHSAPYILAHVLRHGTIGHDAFEPQAYLDETLRPLMNCMTVVADDEIEAVYPDTIWLRLTAVDTTGEHYDVEIANPLGHEKNPMAKADIDAKFTRNAAPLLTADRIADALRTWWSIDDRLVAPALDLLVDDGVAPRLREERSRTVGQASPAVGCDVMTTVTALAANGVLGSGYLTETFQAGIDAGADFIGCDAGSTDRGPYFLGAGVRKRRRVVKPDLRPMFGPLSSEDSGAHRFGRPLRRPHPPSLAGPVVREVAAEVGLHFRMAIIDSEQDKRVLTRHATRTHRSPRVSSRRSRPNRSTVRAHRRADGQRADRGALRRGAQVVVAGRATDTAIFAAVPRMKGLVGGPAWHAAKVIECGASCVENRPTATPWSPSQPR